MILSDEIDTIGALHGLEIQTLKIPRATNSHYRCFSTAAHLTQTCFPGISPGRATCKRLLIWKFPAICTVYVYLDVGMSKSEK